MVVVEDEDARAVRQLGAGLLVLCSSSYVLDRSFTLFVPGRFAHLTSGNSEDIWDACNGACKSRDAGNQRAEVRSALERWSQYGLVAYDCVLGNYWRLISTSI
jgi:hypothetical protein